MVTMKSNFARTRQNTAFSPARLRPCLSKRHCHRRNNRRRGISIDQGKFWTVINSGVTTSLIQSLLAYRGKIYAGTYGDGLCISGDNGKTWAKIDTPFYVSRHQFNRRAAGISSDEEVLSLAVSGKALFAGVNNHGIFRTSDNGSTWTKASSGLKYSYVGCLAANGNVIYSATDSGVYVSDNYGDSWHNVTNGLGNTLVTSLVAGGRMLFAGVSGGGVWQRPLDEMKVAIKEPGREAVRGLAAFTLIAPAKPNASFTVRFSNPHCGRIALQAFDVTGKRLSSLIDRHLRAGVYTYRGKHVVMKGQRRVKKCAYVKIFSAQPHPLLKKENPYQHLDHSNGSCSIPYAASPQFSSLSI
jgi:hypothetical protein